MIPSVMSVLSIKAFRSINLTDLVISILHFILLDLYFYVLIRLLKFIYGAAYWGLYLKVFLFLSFGVIRDDIRTSSLSLGAKWDSTDIGWITPLFVFILRRDPTRILTLMFGFIYGCVLGLVLFYKVYVFSFNY